MDKLPSFTEGDMKTYSDNFHTESRFLIIGHIYYQLWLCQSGSHQQKHAPYFQLLSQGGTRVYALQT